MVTEMDILLNNYREAMREPGMITGQRVHVTTRTHYADGPPMAYDGRVVAWVVQENETMAVVETDGGHFATVHLPQLSRIEEQTQNVVPSREVVAATERGFHTGNLIANPTWPADPIQDIIERDEWQR